MKTADLIDSVEHGTKWIERKRSGACWRVPVRSECLFCTALSLLVVEDSRSSKIIDYLIDKEVWNREWEATIALIIALVEKGYDRLARKIMKRFSQNPHKPSQYPWVPSHLFNALRKRTWGIQTRRRLYSLWFMFTPKRFWCSKTGLLYDFFPSAGILLFSKKKAKINRRIEEVLVNALNEDGSHSGITYHTIRAAYILRQLGNEYYAKKALRWLDKTYNGNGSFRPLLFQDVYDTAWAGLALMGSDQCLGSVVSWLEETKVGPGYPYYSYGYNPDPDDTSLILLLKKSLGQIDKEDYRTLRFLLRSQNPDGGWGFLPLPALSFSFPFNLAFKYFYNFAPRRLPMIEGVYLSTVDMTSRVLITLSYFKDYTNVRQSIKRGVSYLLNAYRNGKFHADFRWTDSDIYETSLALIALYKNGIHSNETLPAINWILSQRQENAEDAGHVLWALLEGRFYEKASEQAELVVSKQQPNGSWKSSVNFFLGIAPYWDEIFSNAIPLFALRSYLNHDRGE